LSPNNGKNKPTGMSLWAYDFFFLFEYCCECKKLGTNVAV